MKFLSKKNKAGFTLLEMIVSLGIFSVVAVIAVGSLVRITSLNRQAQNMQSAMNNINFILEAMTREMRFGSNYNCINTNGTLSDSSLDDLVAEECVANQAGKKGIVFKSAKIGPAIIGDPKYSNGCQLAIGYWFDDDAGPLTNIKRDQQTSCTDEISRAGGVPLIDEGNVKITGYSYSVKKGTNNYSWARIRLAGYAGDKESEKNYFDVRTGVSQRILDI